MKLRARRDRTVERETCARCDVAFAPDRTAGECPVCGERVASPTSERLPADDRVTMIVLVATAANFALLALFALLLLR